MCGEHSVQLPGGSARPARGRWLARSCVCRAGVSWSRGQPGSQPCLAGLAVPGARGRTSATSGDTFLLLFLAWVKVGPCDLAEGTLWHGEHEDILKCSCSSLLNISPSRKPTSH